MPKLTIINVPVNTEDSEFVARVCERDNLLSDMINNGEQLKVIKVMNQRSETDESNMKNFPKIQTNFSVPAKITST